MANRALLVGLNRYPDPASSLQGCVNDVLAMSGLLQRGFGFDATGEIRLLTDERATTARIVERLEWLVRGSAAGDVLVFHFSGHGSQVRDRHGDELDDHLDEIICPYDLDWDHPFTDDDLGRTLEPAAEGAHLVVVLDCCHAGTGLREPEPRPLPDRPRYLGPPADILHRLARPLDAGGEAGRGADSACQVDPIRRFGTSAAGRGAILIAACRADQSAADAWIDGGFHGALTYFLCRALADRGHRASYRTLIGDLRRLLRQRQFQQVPQLECSTALAGRLAFAPFGAARETSPALHGVLKE